MARNLATDADARAAYDEDGSWGRLSEGWPETPYTPGKFLLCTKAAIVPYGKYVVVGAKGNHPYDYSEAVIRCATKALRDRLEEVYHNMFVECHRYIVEETLWPKK